MTSKKYLGDYRLEEYIDGRGRTKTRAIYTGDFYSLEPKVSERDKKLITAATALSWIAYIGALFFAREAARLIYVIVVCRRA